MGPEALDMNHAWPQFLSDNERPNCAKAILSTRAQMRVWTQKLKEEVFKLRRITPVQHIADDHEASTSDVENVEEPNIGSRQSNLDEEQAVNSDVNSNNVDKETASQSNGGAQVEDNSWLTIEDAAEEMEADNSEKLDKEALNNPSGTGSSEVSNQCPQCRKGFSSPGNLSLHIKGVHGPKKECSYCHKMINSVYINRHIREAHMGDTRMQEADRVVQVLRAHAGGPLRIQGKVPSMWKRNISTSWHDTSKKFTIMCANIAPFVLRCSMQRI